MSISDHYFSNFGTPPVPDDICNDSAKRRPRFRRRRFLKGFLSYMGMAVKKVKCQCTTIILAILVDLPSPMIYAKIQPQDILGSGGEHF